MATAEVQHDRLRRRFWYPGQAGGEVAVLEYRLLPTGGVDFFHTLVPEALRGDGIAAQLTTVAVAWAETEAMPIQASCSYVAAWLARHRPEWSAHA